MHGEARASSSTKKVAQPWPRRAAAAGGAPGACPRPSVSGMTSATSAHASPATRRRCVSDIWYPASAAHCAVSMPTMGRQSCPANS